MKNIFYIVVVLCGNLSASDMNSFNDENISSSNEAISNFINADFTDKDNFAMCANALLEMGYSIAVPTILDTLFASNQNAFAYENAYNDAIGQIDECLKTIAERDAMIDNYSKKIFGKAEQTNVAHTKTAKLVTNTYRVNTCATEQQAKTKLLILLNKFKFAKKDLLFMTDYEKIKNFYENKNAIKLEDIKFTCKECLEILNELEVK